MNKSRIKAKKNNVWIFDGHQDIAISVLYTTRTSFLKKNRIKDGSNNLNLMVNNQTDLPRLLGADVRGVFAAICPFGIRKGKIVPSKSPDIDTYEQLIEYHKIIRNSGNNVFIIRTQNDLKKIKKGRVGLLLHIEGADMFADNINSLEILHSLGVRSIGLTWNYNNKLAGGTKSKGELSVLGREIIKRMNNGGIILDLAHLNLISTNQALKASKKAPIISHTNCKSIYKHPRNVDDDILKEVARRGGLIGISGVPKFIGEKPTLDSLSDHIIHATNICGEDSVFLGTDFGSMTSEKLVPNYSHVSDIPNLLDVMKKRGLNNKTLTKIGHANIIRFLSENLPIKP